MEWVLPLRHEALTPIFLALTALGDTLFYLVALAIGYWLADRPAFRRLAFLVTLTAILNSWLKGYFAIERPTQHPLAGRSRRLQLPSGHAQLAAFAWLWLALEFRRQWLSILAAVLTAGIAASRVYLGVHTPTDVAAGILIGVLTVAIAWQPAHHPPAAWAKAAASPALRRLGAGTRPGLPIFPRRSRSRRGGRRRRPAGIPARLAARAGPRRPLASGWKKIAAVALGLGVAIAIRILGKILLQKSGLGEAAADFLRYALIALWVVWLAPRSFRLLGFERQ